MDKITSSSNSDENIAYVAALINHILLLKGKNVLCMMPYLQNLESFADWFIQLWAESLGKKHALNGKIVHAGQTPIRAIGARDQHSQIQLFNEGPNDKLIWFLEAEKPRVDSKIPLIFEDDESCGFLQGKTLSQIYQAEKRGTESALTANQRPNMTFRLNEMSARTMGELIFLFEMTTVYMARLLNINPFDQPGVEAGKEAAFALLGKKGYKPVTQKKIPIFSLML
jgi:glucose-6-phosphate isomerase